jgi:hypothetical protein
MWPVVETRFAFGKDTLQNWLRKWARSGGVSLQDARTSIANDWIAVWGRMSGGPQKSAYIRGGGYEVQMPVCPLSPSGAEKLHMRDPGQRDCPHHRRQAQPASRCLPRRVTETGRGLLPSLFASPGTASMSFMTCK